MIRTSFSAEIHGTSHSKLVGQGQGCVHAGVLVQQRLVNAASYAVVHGRSDSRIIDG